MIPSRESLLLGALALAAFGASLTAPFHFDDWALFRDPAVTSASGWWQAWRPEQTRPLTWFTFWANYQAGGRNPIGYHGVNLLLHVAAALLLRDTLARLLPARPALLAAALFALHPIQTEPIVYVFARGTLLATLLSLASLGDWLRGRHWRAVAWFAAALAAKEECAAFPLVLLLLHVALSRSRAELPPIAAMLALALAAGIRAAWMTALAPGSGAGPQAGLGAWEYLATQGVVVLRYFRLLLVPVGFTVDPDVAVVAGWRAWLAWGALLAAAAIALRGFRRAREGFWFLAGLLLLLPSSSVFPASDLAADRRMYLPMVAFSAAAGLLLDRLDRRALAAGAVILVVLSFGRVLVWRSERALWEEAARLAPRKVRPKIHLARALDLPDAARVLEEARQIAPDDAAVAAELGRVYFTRKRYPEALAEFGRALALSPNDSWALNNRGLALMALGQHQAARDDFRRALQWSPCLFDARFNLGQLGEKHAAPESCRFSDAQRRLLEGDDR